MAVWWVGQAIYERCGQVPLGRLLVDPSSPFIPLQAIQPTKSALQQNKDGRQLFLHDTRELELLSSPGVKIPWAEVALETQQLRNMYDEGGNANLTAPRSLIRSDFGEGALYWRPF